MKICIFIHLFYTELLDELLAAVSHLSTYPNIEYDLIVTLCAHNANLEDRIYSFKDNTQILIVDNRGYDIAPFLTALKTINLSQYDYLVKLHSKRDLKMPSYLPSAKFIGDKWRKKLLEFISSPEAIGQTLTRFKENPQIGMISSPELIVKASKEDAQANFRAQKIMRGMGFLSYKEIFVAGTMFMARARLFKAFQQLPYDADDFEEFDPAHKGGSLAHALERVLGFMISAQGYKIDSYYPVGLSFYIHTLGYKIKQFIYYDRTNSKGIRHIKICKIPVYKKQYDFYKN